MNSCIIIDGFALWVVMILFVALLVGFICFGNLYISEARENDRLKSRIKHYSAQLKEYEQTENNAEYKDGFLTDIISEGHKTAKQKDGLSADIILLDILPPQFPKGGERRG